jgi:phosphate starvation-inducible PhoH-like protein
LRGEFSRLILSRPCVEAYGEKLGFLPGDASEKIEPYILPMLDLIGHTYSVKDIQGMIRDKIIISRPIAYMRGMTFINDYVVLDEGQNTIAAQMRLLLTRIGENSKIVVTGDTTQSDIDGLNGLTDAIKRLEGIPGIGIVKFTEESVVRSQIIREIEKRYLANNNE